MKTLLLLICVMLVCSAVSASETSWRIDIRADNGAGSMGGIGCLIGVHPGASDGWDEHDGPVVPEPPIPPYAWVVSAIPPDSGLYSRDLHEYSLEGETWTLYSGVTLDYPNPTYRIYLQTLSVSAVLPPSSIAGKPVNWRLTMVNNKGIVGAPTNGTAWDFSVPDTIGTVFFDLTLPVNKVPQDFGSMQAMGYEFQLDVYPVPEPSSLLIFTAGLSGVVGTALRRRVRT